MIIPMFLSSQILTTIELRHRSRGGGSVPDPNASPSVQHRVSGGGGVEDPKGRLRGGDFPPQPNHDLPPRPGNAQPRGGGMNQLDEVGPDGGRYDGGGDPYLDEGREPPPGRYGDYNSEWYDERDGQWHGGGGSGGGRQDSYHGDHYPPEDDRMYPADRGQPGYNSSQQQSHLSPPGGRYYDEGLDGGRHYNDQGGGGFGDYGGGDIVYNDSHRRPLGPVNNHGPPPGGPPGAGPPRGYGQGGGGGGGGGGYGYEDEY